MKHTATRKPDAWDAAFDYGQPADRRLVALAVTVVAVAVLYLLLSTPLRTSVNEGVTPATAAPAVEFEETP